VDRRRFLIRSLGAAIASLLPRAAGSQGPGSNGARDSTRDTMAMIQRLASVAPTVTIAAGGDTTLGYNLQDHFDQQLALGTPKDKLWPLYSRASGRSSTPPTSRS
jgi:hypothetical protein